MMEAPAAKKYCKDKKSILYPKNGKTYAITITSNPRYTDGPYDFMHQCSMIMPVIIKHFRYLGRLKLYPELTEKANIHFHGDFTCTDGYKYPKVFKKICSEIGWLKLYEIDDHKGWETYCTKESEEIRPYLVPNYLPDIPFLCSEYTQWVKDKKQIKRDIANKGPLGQIFELIKANAAV